MPATPTFTTVDNGDGTATVTVAGADGGSTNTVYAAAVSNQWGDAISWTSKGSRSGNGAVSFSLAAGVYFLIVTSALSGSTAVTTPQYFHLTGATVAQLEWILQGVQARLRLMTLETIAASDRNSYAAIDEIDTARLERPSAVAAPVDVEQLRAAGVPVGLDGIVYPVCVALFDPANRDQSAANRAKWFLWREIVRAGFLNQRLPTTMGGNLWAAWCGEFRALPILDRAWWKANAFVSTQVFLFQVNEERGLR